MLQGGDGVTEQMMHRDMACPKGRPNLVWWWAFPKDAL